MRVQFANQVSPWRFFAYFKQCFSKPTDVLPIMSTTLVPGEIWVQIFGHLSKRDLKALRLSGNHYLGSLASSLLFKTAYIAARKGVIDTFMAVTTHPEYRKYVQEIVYDSSHFSPDVVVKHLHERYGPALTTLFREQEHILNTELQKSLDKAFACLSNIKRVTYADMTRVACLPGDFNGSSCELLDDEKELLICKNEAARPTASDYPCRLKPGIPCKGHEDNRRNHTKPGGFITLMQALASHKAHKVPHLSLGNRRHAAGTGGISYWFFSRFNTEITHPFLGPVFASLRTLDLTVSSDWPLELQHERCCTSQKPSRDVVRKAARGSFASVDLATLLCPAQNLQEIKLAGECLTYSLRLTDTFSGHTWSKLQVVTLQYFEGSAQEIEDFVTRHAMSLTHLSVDHFVLTSGSWKPLGRALPAVAPNLQLIFGFVYAGNYYCPVENIFPLTSRDFDESGLKIKDEISRWSAEDEDDEDEDSESDSDSDSDRLYYSSDDSTPSTASNPRRKPDVDLLDTLAPATREMVESLQAALPGCPVDQCLNMLDEKDDDLEKARKALFRRFGYTMLECLVRGSLFFS